MSASNMCIRNGEGGALWAGGLEDMEEWICYQHNPEKVGPSINQFKTTWNPEHTERFIFLVFF